MLGQLPRADTGLQDLVGVWRGVNKVGDPGVPEFALVYILTGDYCPCVLREELTSRAQCGMRRIRPPCSRPIVYGLNGETISPPDTPAQLLGSKSRLTRQFLLHVLEVLVSEAIGSDQSSGLGITWNSMNCQSTAARVPIEE